jgi:two-component system response regulator HydG/two-component system response regulator AtoC
MDCFLKYRWPGNIRELRNVLEKAMLLGEGKVITLDHLPEEMKSGKASLTKGNVQASTLEELEKGRVLEVLNQNGWNQSRAAELLGIHRNTLRDKIRKWNIRLPDAAGGL